MTDNVIEFPSVEGWIATMRYRLPAEALVDVPPLNEASIESMARGFAQGREYAVKEVLYDGDAVVGGVIQMLLGDVEKPDEVRAVFAKASTLLPGAELSVDRGVWLRPEQDAAEASRELGPPELWADRCVAMINLIDASRVGADARGEIEDLLREILHVVI